MWEGRYCRHCGERRATTVVSLPGTDCGLCMGAGRSLLKMSTPAGWQRAEMPSPSLACPASRVCLPSQPGLSARISRLACLFPRLACLFPRFVCPAARLACPDEGDFLLKSEWPKTFIAILYPYHYSGGGRGVAGNPLIPTTPLEDRVKTALIGRRVGKLVSRSIIVSLRTPSRSLIILSKRL